MKSKCCNLNNNDLASNEIDFEHKIESVVNDCKVTIYFINNRNDQVERNVLENAIEMARSIGAITGLIVLLQYQNRIFGAKKKTFDF